MPEADAPAHDRTLISAIGAALDRVEYHLEQADELMADVSGGIVRKLLTHPNAALFSSDIEWRWMLARWNRLRAGLGAPPVMLADLIEHYAGVLLVDATRAAALEARAN